MITKVKYYRDSKALMSLRPSIIIG